MEEQFYKLLSEPNEKGCILWKGGFFNTGYGVIRGNLAHRVAYTLAKGAIPANMHVLHKCDVPACVNPDHLFLGTHLDNIADKHTKERDARGESHGNSKLTEDDVREIRRRCAAGEKQKDVQEDFPVSKASLSMIVNRINWGWLD